MGEKAGATKDIRVRQAIEKALNLDALTAVGSAGFGEVALGYFPTDSKYYNAVYTPEELAVDIDGAKALLEEAGYGNGLELRILGLQDTVPLYTVIQENLKQIGITLTIETPDVPSFVAAANDGDYDLIQVGDYCTHRFPPVMMSLRWANINTFTIGGTKYTTEELENSIYAAIEEPDEAKAKEMFRGVEEYIKENTMLTNICPEMHGVVIANDLKGFTTMERGYLDVTNFYK
jgi:peptide/nickel transport system substrate-binding protein